MPAGRNRAAPWRATAQPRRSEGEKALGTLVRLWYGTGSQRKLQQTHLGDQVRPRWLKHAMQHDLVAD